MSSTIDVPTSPYAGGMRWFTRAWHRGDLGDAYDYEAVVDAYWVHVQGILPLVPPSIRELAHLSLHDARFEEVTVAPQRRTIRLRLIGGDVEHGYSSLDLIYRGAVLEGMETNRFKHMVERPRTEILYDEIDTQGTGQFEHRFLIWPEGEFTIRFEDVELTRTGVSARHYSDAVGRFAPVNEP